MVVKINLRGNGRPFAIDRGYGVEYVRYSASRENRPAVIGYGSSPEEAAFNLLFNVQPDLEGDLDGLGPFPTPYVGGNMFPPYRYQL